MSSHVAKIIARYTVSALDLATTSCISLFQDEETKRGSVEGMNSLYFPLRHHTYIYKKVRLYIRYDDLLFLNGYSILIRYC